MIALKLIIGVGICLALFAIPVFTQSSTKPKVSIDKSAGKTNLVAKAEAERIRRARHEQARSLLLTLGNDARRFSNQTLRARTLARVADALWDVDDEQGRILFREAWKAAETADQDKQKRLNLRAEVLKLIATRDHLLAEELLKKLKADEDEREAKAESSSENNVPSRNKLWELPEALEKRLTLAEDLLNAGDIERALQFADPVLGNVTISTVDFLALLRGKNPAAADQRYAAMLANTSGNALADANMISVLSSYIFTPQTYFIFNDIGTYDVMTVTSPFSAASVSPQLRLSFFQTASSVLLRPQSSSEQGQNTDEAVIKYMVLKQLIPLFERYAPRELTDGVRGQLEILSPLINDSVRKSENEWRQQGISPEKQFSASQEQHLMEQIERAKTSDERDDLYFKLALLTLKKDDLKARDIVGKIEESEFRKRAQGWVDTNLAISAIRKKKIEMALELSRNGDLTHIQRVWLLTQAAKLLAKTDRDKASLLINDATAEARRIEAGTLDKPRGLLAVANALLMIEPSRKWEATFDAIKAANSTKDFTGSGGGLVLQFSSRVLISRGMEAVPDFDIEGIFGKLAKDDFDEAVQLAVNFQGEASRTNAIIAVTRSVLSEKNVSVPKPKDVTLKSNKSVL